jgi:two-component system, OmpR family, response regulator ChvI
MSNALKEFVPAPQKFEAQASWRTIARPDRRIRLFFVDDDDLYRDTVEAELIEEGFSVEGFADGEALFARLAAGGEADVIILDWGLTKTPGIDLLPQLRERGVDLPIVFLTGRNSPTHESLALGRGAIDFIDKGRGTSILATRLRIAASKVHASQTSAPEPTLVVGKLVLKLNVNRACWEGKDVELTITEYKIVHLLATKTGTFVRYREIYDAMHYAGFLAGTGEGGYRTNVRSSIKRIRNKFKECSADFSEITNYNGFGYCWGTGLIDLSHG